MTISEIIARLRKEINDDGTNLIYEDVYYTDLIISGIGDLESFMGKISIRDNSYQFQPIRGADREVTYKEDGVTPEIDAELLYDPTTEDDHSPLDIFVNKGLKIATGKTTGHIETADYLDEFGIHLLEEDIAFIKLDADVVIPSGATIAFDVSLDNRESYLVADYGYALTITATRKSTGFIDVSRIPSSYTSLKWTLNGATSPTIKNTTFWRYYIPREKIRHFGNDIIELARLRLLEIRLDKTIKHQNDPMVINGLLEQINIIRRKYGLDKFSGETKPSGGGRGVCYYPPNREESKIFNLEQSSDFFADGRVVSITNTGFVRRTT